MNDSKKIIEEVLKIIGNCEKAVKVYEETVGFNDLSYAYECGIYAGHKILIKNYLLTVLETLGE